MANQKISELTEATDCTGSELVAVVQGGTTKKAPLNTRIKAYLGTLYSPVKTYITAQATPTRVTSGPSSLGNYRSYLRNAGARTYTETNGTPSTAPSSSNGYLLYSNAAWASGDSSGQPSRYEIYIGINKEPIFEFYRNTGRTGFIDVTPFYGFGGGNYDGGVFYSYDPATGIASITKAYPSGGTVSAGMDAAGSPIASTIYFDIKC